MSAGAWGPKTLKILAALRADPTRGWTSDELAALVEVDQGNVGNYTHRPIKARLIERELVGRRFLFRAVVGEQPRPVVLVDVRTPQVTEGWTPPKMVCVRPGADLQLPSLGAFRKGE